MAFKSYNKLCLPTLCLKKDEPITYFVLVHKAMFQQTKTGCSHFDTSVALSHVTLSAPILKSLEDTKVETIKVITLVKNWLLISSIEPCVIFWILWHSLDQGQGKNAKNNNPSHC